MTGDIPKELEEREKVKYSEDIDRLTKVIDTMENEMDAVKKEHEARMDTAKAQYKDIVNKLQTITKKLMKTDDYRCVLASNIKGK